MTTTEALSALGVSRSHSYRVIAALRRCGVAEPHSSRSLTHGRPAEVNGKRVTWKQYAADNGLSGDWTRARLYGMEPQGMHAIYLKQDGCCYLCGDPLSPDLGKVHIEHDHACCPSPARLGGGKISCGKCVRGIACSPCNRLIAAANDDPYRLRRIADNLEGANHRVATARLRERWMAAP
jgi:hypothetical protein